jgi:tripartite-type tricarboxylate transporter receptor subunit TctC
MPWKWLPAVAAFIAVIVGGGAGLAQSQQQGQQDDYFKGKTIAVYVGQPPGGGYDLYGRLFARNLGRHLPGNPTVIVSNMPGAQGILSANFLYRLAPRDGTALALLAQYACQDQVVGTLGVQYDAAKFNWIGRLAANIDILYVWNSVPIKTADDLKYRETLVASDGGLATNYVALLNVVMGATRRRGKRISKRTSEAQYRRNSPTSLP